MALISAAKQAANRANAARSTGPRTPDGKNVVRFNAVKHGMCAEHAVLPGEHEAAFQALLADLLARLAPEGDGQRCAVELAAREFWRLRRGGLAETGALEQLANPYLLQSKHDAPTKREVYVLGATLWQDFGEAGFLDKLSRYEARSGRALERALRVLERLRALSAAAPPREKAQSSAKIGFVPPRKTPSPGSAGGEGTVAEGGVSPKPGGDLSRSDGEGEGQGSAWSGSPSPARRPDPNPLPQSGRGSEKLQFSAEFGFVSQNRAALLGSVSPLALAPVLAPEIRWPPGWARA